MSTHTSYMPIGKLTNTDNMHLTMFTQVATQGYLISEIFG